MNKQITPAIVALVLILWASYGDFSYDWVDWAKEKSNKEENQHQQWVNLIHKYENIINKKKLDYNNVNISDLGLKNNKENEVLCPLNTNRICKIKQLDKDSFTVYIPKKDSTVILVGSVVTTLGGTKEKDLFTYYKDNDGKLKVKAKTYDFW